MPKTRVLVVDDTVVIRRLVSEVISRDPDLEVAGIAPNGSIALKKLPQLAPDLVTLDMEMPEMDGIATLKELRKSYPDLPVVMLSSLTKRGAEATLEALAAGANDYVAKPSRLNNLAEAMARLQETLLPVVKAHSRAARVAPDPVSHTPLQPIRSTQPPLHARQPIDIVAIGTSTGGPNALASLFEKLPAPLPVPIVIVQHMPPVFTKSLAERLDRAGPTRFAEAEEGQLLEPGHAYIAPGGRHMEIQRSGPHVAVRLHDGPPENSCRPAVDVLFRSVAATYGPNALALVMTGMGRDGFLGAQVIRERGGRALAQDEASSVVWGMPSYLAKSGLAEAVLPLDRLAEAIATRVDASRFRNACRR